MNLYYQLIENPLFFKWIFHPSPEINTYWEHYLEQHPEDAKLIREFKAGYEKHFSYKKSQLNEDEKRELAFKILKQLELKDKKSKSAILKRNLLRYAAVAIFFILIGGGLSYLVFDFNRQNQFVEIPPVSQMNLKEPTLIFDDNTEISLNQGKSELKYSTEGELLVNKEKIDIPETQNPVQLNTLVIPYGNTSMVTLADGTEVWLNAGSRMIYPSRFNDKNREVFLVGEAFFKVSKNEEHPFIVKTPDINIKVLGTQFNLSAYADENIIQTVLAEGSIELSRPNAGIFEQSIIIVPGQLATLNKTTKETRLYEVDVDYYTGWKEGYLNFQNTDLNRIIKKLERYYNIRCRYDNPVDGTIKISGKLDISNDKETVFKYMNSLTGLNFNKINETYYMIK